LCGQDSNYLISLNGYIGGWIYASDENQAQGLYAEVFIGGVKQYSYQWNDNDEEIVQMFWNSAAYDGYYYKE